MIKVILLRAPCQNVNVLLSISSRFRDNNADNF